MKDGKRPEDPTGSGELRESDEAKKETTFFLHVDATPAEIDAVSQAIVDRAMRNLG